MSAEGMTIPLAPAAASRWSEAAVRAAIAAHFGASDVQPHGDLMARMRRALDAAEQRRRAEEDARPHTAEVMSVYVVAEHGIARHRVGTSADPHALAEHVARAVTGIDDPTTPWTHWRVVVHPLGSDEYMQHCRELADRLDPQTPAPNPSQGAGGTAAEGDSPRALGGHPATSGGVR